MMRVRSQQGSILGEYGTLIAVTVSAILVMAVYTQRAIAGRLRGAADSIGEQYAPGEVDSQATVTSSGKTTTTTRLQPTVLMGNTVLGQETTTRMDEPEVTHSEGFENIGPLKASIWD